MIRAFSLLLFCFPAVAGAADAAAGDEIAAKLAIQELIAEYAFRWDGKQSGDFAELFTEDAIMERRQDGALVPGSRLKGKAEILDYARESHTGRLADRQSRHHMTGIRFLELSDGEALTENLALITHQTANDPVPVIRSTGIYRISWRLTPEGWKMSRRILFTDRPGN